MYAAGGWLGHQTDLNVFFIGNQATILQSCSPLPNNYGNRAIPATLDFSTVTVTEMTQSISVLCGKLQFIILVTTTNHVYGVFLY